MKCPFCGNLGDKVVDSRESKEGEVIRRRRECLDCGRRFTSYERIDEIPYMVIKKDGTRERFERQKLVAGLLKACEKRPVSIAAIEGVADSVEATLQERPEKEMATEEIGSLVMDELKRLDKVACAIRLRLPALPGHRRVHERAQRSAERQGVSVPCG
jgi:transcriptional repressor NrdR